MNMKEEDWDLARQLSRVRNERFPMYERKAVQVFKLVEEDEEGEILQFVQEFVKDQEIDDFHRARLLMVIISKIGTCTSLNFTYSLPITHRYEMEWK